MTMNLTPIANRPLPLVDQNKASAVVGYLCLNVVLDVDEATGGGSLPRGRMGFSGFTTTWRGDVVGGMGGTVG